MPNKIKASTEEVPYWFKKMDRFQMVELVNKEHPISLIHFEKLIDRISDRYPLLPKTKIVQIIQTAFETMREMLIVGHHLAITGIAKRMKLYFTRKWKSVAVRVSITSPDLEE
jgi:hypothetical protein